MHRSQAVGDGDKGAGFKDKSITAPDKLRIQVRNHDILDDDIGNIYHHQPFAEKNVLVPLLN